jgi:hypothetical protein
VYFLLNISLLENKPDSDVAAAEQMCLAINSLLFTAEFFKD